MSGGKCANLSAFQFPVSLLRVELRRFPKWCGLFQCMRDRRSLGRVGLSALPSVYIISENAIERFRFICCPLKIMRGGIYFRPDNEGLLQGARLGKMPLGLKLSIKSRIESAVACASRSDPREIVSLVLAYWRTPNHQRQETQFRSSNSSASLRGANPFVPAWPKNLSCIC